ncbi:hypothetical protein BD770DRAFT_394044, partial [Pilaira anomala]
PVDRILGFIASTNTLQAVIFLGPGVFPPSRGCCPVSIIVVFIITLRTKRTLFFYLAINNK